MDIKIKMINIKIYKKEIETFEKQHKLEIDILDKEVKRLQDIKSNHVSNQ